jgi:hypothetical protein
MSRNYTCSVGWMATVSFLCLVLLAPERSAACSCGCYYPTWGFVSGGGLIPSNSPGLLWWGEFEGSNGTDQALPVQIASASGEPLPVEYKSVSKDPPRSLWLFWPRDGFKIGKSYVFTTNRICQRVTRMLGGPSIDGPSWEQRISVTVSDQAAVSPAGPVALKIGEPTTGALQIAKGVSCSESVTAAQLPIEMDLPETIMTFRDQLYFETIIDGTHRWSPSASICTIVLPGASWRGKGVDLLFSICGDMPALGSIDGNLSALLARGGLAAGRHTVEMRASLPGTDFLAVTSKVEVELRCQKEPDHPVDGDHAIRNVDLQAYCARRSFTGVRNLDGTGYGWRCTPGDANIDVNQACAEQHGSDFAAQLLSKPPGGPNDWRCRRIYH